MKNSNFPAPNKTSAHLKKLNYTKEDVNAIKTENQELQEHIYMISQTYVLGFDTVPEALEAFNTALKQLNELLDYNLNKSHNGRKIILQVNKIR